MFVRFIMWEEDQSPTPSNTPGNLISHDYLYECRSIQFHQLEQGEGDPETMLMVLEGKVPYFPQEFFVVKDHLHEIYIMNNDGKTIDSYRWDQTQ